MSRQNGLSRVYASASVIALVGLIAGCSQPASYATVDLGGSYGNGVQQAYSARSGLPVYRSTQVYTTPYGVGTGQPAPQQSQLVYRDVPFNQTASLGPGFVGGYSQPLLPYETADQGPILTDETVLRTDGFIDLGPYDGAQTAALAPGAGSIGLDRMSIATDVPQYLPAPQGAAPVYEAEPILQAEPLPRYSAIAPVETIPLPAPTQGVDESYAAPLAQSVAIQAPTYAPVESTPLEGVQAPAETVASLSGQPARDDIQGVIGYFDLRRDQQDGMVQDARLPLAVPTPAPPVAATPAPGGQGIVLPPASQEYPRPYEALPPGFFPTYDFPSGNDLISQATPVTEAPLQFASLDPQPAIGEIFGGTVVDLAPLPRIEQASGRTLSGSSHTIRQGDTLYGIARQFGVTPLAIAQANGMPLAGTIYPGTVLKIPGDVVAGRPETLGDAPVVVLQTASATPVTGTYVAEAASTNTFTTDLTDQSVEMIDIDELARMFRDRESGQVGAAMPIISAEVGSAMRGRPDMTPTEIISEPVGTVSAPAFVVEQEMTAPTPMTSGRVSYAWPVHGEVYRLDGGGIQIRVPAGQTVAASAGGRVVHVENGPRGILVVIEHDDGWRSLTIGLAAAAVQVGQRVLGGSTLGYSGSQRIGFELRDTSSAVAETLGILRG